MMALTKDGCLILLNARLVAFQVGGTKKRGEEVRKGIEEVQTEK